jgi:hypothetical protein
MRCRRADTTLTDAGADTGPGVGPCPDRHGTYAGQVRPVPLAA